MGCCYSKQTMTVSTTTTHTQSSTVGGRTVANVSSTTHTTPSHGKPTTTHNNYQTVTYHGTERVAQPLPGVVRDPGLPPPTPLEEYIRPTWAYDALVGGLFWSKVTNDVKRRRQNPKQNWAPNITNGAVTFSNGIDKTDAYPVVQIATMKLPKPKNRFSKKEAEPIKVRWAWADEQGSGDEKAAGDDAYDTQAIRHSGETQAIPELSMSEFALEGDFNPFIYAAARALGLPIVYIMEGDAKRSVPQGVYLLHSDLASFPASPPLRPPTLKELDGDLYRGLMVQGRVVENGVLKRHGAAAPECLQALADKMGWDFYDLGSWYADLQGKEHIGMRDPKMNAEWEMRSEYDIVNGRRETRVHILYKARGMTGQYTRSFTE